MVEDKKSTFESIVEVSEDVIKPIKVSIDEAKLKSGKDVADGAQNDFTSKRNVAEGMMDIALLTANANQLRLVLMLKTTSVSFYICMGLIIFSLMLQVIIGFGLIYKVGCMLLELFFHDWHFSAISATLSLESHGGKFLQGLMITWLEEFSSSLWLIFW